MLEVNRCSPTVVEITACRPSSDRGSGRTLQWLAGIAASSLILHMLRPLPFQVPFLKPLIANSLSIPTYALPIIVALTLLSAIMMARSNRMVKRTKNERLLAIRGLGVLLSSNGSQRFVDASEIHAPIINEAITVTTVYPYLALILKNSTKMVLCFPNSRPWLKLRRDIVPAFTALREVLNLDSDGERPGVEKSS